jgi:hypothetical protein
VYWKDRGPKRRRRSRPTHIVVQRLDDSAAAARSAPARSPCWSSADNSVTYRFDDAADARLARITDDVLSAA